MVWCGVVRCGVMWCGVVWCCSVVWCGTLVRGGGGERGRMCKWEEVKMSITDYVWLLSLSLMLYVSLPLSPVSSSTACVVVVGVVVGDVVVGGVVVCGGVGGEKIK